MSERSPENATAASSPPAETRRAAGRLRWLWLLLPVLLVAGPCGLLEVQHHRESPAIMARWAALREAVAQGRQEEAMRFVRKPQRSYHPSFTQLGGDILKRESLLNQEYYRKVSVSVSFHGRYATLYMGGGWWESGEEFGLFKDTDGLWYFTGEWQLYLD